MKVTKHSRHQQNRNRKHEERKKRLTKKKKADRTTKQLQSVKMRLSLSNKEGHVSSIKEYLGVIEGDITQFTNCVQPAIDMMDMICGNDCFKEWRKSNERDVSIMIEEIEFCDQIIVSLRRARDDAKRDLESFIAAEFEDKEIMLQSAFGVILAIASSMDTAREGFENIGTQLADRVQAIKPELDALLPE